MKKTYPITESSGRYDKSECGYVLSFTCDVTPPGNDRLEAFLEKSKIETESVGGNLSRFTMNAADMESVREVMRLLVGQKFMNPESVEWVVDPLPRVIQDYQKRYKDKETGLELLVVYDADMAGGVAVDTFLRRHGMKSECVESGEHEGKHMFAMKAREVKRAVNVLFELRDQDLIGSWLADKIERELLFTLKNISVKRGGDIFFSYDTHGENSRMIIDRVRAHNQRAEARGSGMRHIQVGADGSGPTTQTFIIGSKDTELAIRWIEDFQREALVRSEIAASVLRELGATKGAASLEEVREINTIRRGAGIPDDKVTR